MEYSYASPEHRLYDAATRWYPEPGWAAPKHLIDAAVQCLVDGLDSPSLRILAGASPSDRREDLKKLLEATLDELDIPVPDERSPWQQVVAAGKVLSGAATDRLRLEVRPAHGSVGGHELLIYVNDVEMTRIAAGMGMDPFDVLIPDNRLIATTEPHQVPIARCECGTYGCGSTDVTIVRDGDAVNWEWIYEAPLDHGVTFPAAQYDAEVTRVAADHSWERAEDTLARLVLTQLDRDRLATQGFSVSWAAKDHANSELFKLALFTGNADHRSAEPGYQTFLRFPIEGREPQHVAADIADELRTPPHTWRASWHAIKQGVDHPPPMAGLRWRRERVGR